MQKIRKEKPIIRDKSKKRAQMSKYLKKVNGKTMKVNKRYTFVGFYERLQQINVSLGH